MIPELNKIYLGNSIETMRSWPDNFIQMCVTSPPYWGLRDYGTPPQVWGGNPQCVHRWGEILKPSSSGLVNGEQRGKTANPNSATRRPHQSSLCLLCEAWMGHLGLEPTPEMFVDHLVLVFSEVFRVLKSNGTFWLNIGDCYASTGGHTKQGKSSQRRGRANVNHQHKVKGIIPPGLKQKDLIGVPWMLAFALRRSGWYLRSEIIWSKKNCMPESVKDRPTKSHETIFLLTKSDKYYYDQDSIREPHSHVSIARVSRGRSNNHKYLNGGPVNQTLAKDIKRACHPKGKNKRTVWSISTRAFPEAHFATFPEELPKTCILAGSREGDVVLDPFMGAGTTGLVAAKLGRKFIGTELSLEYKNMADKRIEKELEGKLL